MEGYNVDIDVTLDILLSYTSSILHTRSYSKLMFL